MRIPVLIAIVALLLLSACTTTQTFLTTDEKLAKADELYAARKYARAAELYSEVYFERASAASPYALLRQADCYFRINKFSEARIAYQEFISTYGTHSELNTAYYRTALCLYEESLPAQYDQTETQHAIDAFKKFIDKYPADPRYNEALDYIRKAQYKLLEKKYLNGYIYYRMKDYSSALMYFQEITELGNTDSLDRQSLYYSALLLHKQKLADQARVAYNALLSKYPGSKESKKLAKLFEMIKQALLGGSFDPIHAGHLHLAREILNSGLVSSVVFLPNAHHNFKQGKVLLDFAQRYELVQNALEPGMEVWDDDSTGSGYTSDLLRRLFAIYPHRKFLWVIGSDNLPSLPLWHDYKWLRVSVRFLIIPRPGYPLDPKVVVRIKRHTLWIEPSPISSTDVRQRIAEGKSISGLVPQHLEQRIIDLYRPLLVKHGD